MRTRIINTLIQIINFFEINIKDGKEKHDKTENRILTNAPFSFETSVAS